MSVLRRKINVYILYHYCKHVLPMCNKVVIKIDLSSAGVCKYYIGPIGPIGDLSLSTATVAG